MGAKNWARLPLAKLVIEFCAEMLIGYSVACLILNLNYYSCNLNFSKFFQVWSSPAVVMNTDINVNSDETLMNSTGITFPTSHQSPDEGYRAGEDVEAQRFSKKVRVLCWIMTGPSNHHRKAIHVKNTWGKRCNNLIFMSSESDEKLGAVGLPNVKEGRDWLWAKTKEAFKYVWKHHRNDAEWFFKADDDTYAIVENLRYMLSQFDPQNPIYFGARFRMRPFVNGSYMSGGCGYVLSREALRRFVEQALPDKNKCRQSHDGREDIEMGRCLEAVGVEAGDSTDAFGRHRFFHFPPAHHAMPGYIQQSSWYWKSIYYPQSQGIAGCSDVAISFHCISPNQMYLLEYLIYHLRIFTGKSGPHEWRMEPNDKSSTDKTTVSSRVLAPKGNSTLVHY